MAHAQPENYGPHPFEEWDAGRVAVEGVSIRTRVIYPTDLTTPAPIVLIMHGNYRNGSFHVTLGRDFASRGIIAILPDMPCGLGGCDHDANARQIRALLAWAVEQSSGSDNPLVGRVDPERRAAMGHSYGGLGTFLAASIDPTIDVWVGFDPQEDGTDAISAAPNVAIPSAHLMADIGGACNGDWGANIAQATTGPHLRTTIVSSAHCDPEEPTDQLCSLACAAGNPDTTVIYRRYAVAFIACALDTDPAMGAWIGGSELERDVSAGRLGDLLQVRLDEMPCAGRETEVDAGPPRADAGPGAVDGGSIDAGPADPGQDAGVGGPVDAGGEPSGSSGGCGCRVWGRPLHAPRGALWGWGFIAALLLARRRARRPG